MSEPTGSFGEYGNGPWYYDIHDGSEHQRNRYQTRSERDEAARKAKDRHPGAKVKRGNVKADSRAE